MKKISLFIGALCSIAITVLYYTHLHRKITGPTTMPGDISVLPNTQTNIRNLSIRAGETIQSPFTISGEARGWYFEGSFPIHIVDAIGAPIASGLAQAKSDWMTNDFVPFTATVSFASPQSPDGTIILQKDNPSGDSSFDQEIRIPIQFDTTKHRAVLLYFYSPKKDTNVACDSQDLVAVTRMLPMSKTPIQDTLKTLLSGPTPQEQSLGLTSDFPLPGVTLSSASLSNGTLTLSFSDPSHHTSGGSCKVGILRAQIEATAMQFSEVTAVRFKPDTVFQP